MRTDSEPLEHPRQLAEITLGDDPSGWERLGFRLDTLDDGSARLSVGSTSVRLTGTGGGFLDWTVEGGTPEVAGLPAGTNPGPAGVPGTAHPNGITSIDHVVVTTGDVERTAAELDAAGIDARGERSTTSYGAPMRQLFFWLGDVILELVGPAVGEPTRDDPAALFGLALVSSDIDLTVEHLGELASAPKDAVQPGRRIAGIRADRVGVSIPLAVMSPHPR